MEKFNNLTDMEFNHLLNAYSKAFESWCDGTCQSKAFRNVIRWCGRRGITAEEFWDWVND